MPIAMARARETMTDYIDYQRYMQSAEWQAVRARYWRSRLPKECYCCGYNGPLELHHRSYKSLGQEKLMHLVPLCSPCHRRVHVIYKLKKQQANYLGGLWGVTNTLRRKWRKKLRKTRGR